MQGRSRGTRSNESTSVRRMIKYEVRVTQTHVDYYQVEANSEQEARAFVKAQVNDPKNWVYATKVDTIKRTPVIDYALQITPEGEPIL